MKSSAWLRWGLVLCFVFALAAFALADPSAPGGSQARLQASGQTWVRGHTSMSDLSYAEKMMRLGARPPAVPDSVPRFVSKRKIADVPAHLDWRENGGDFITPVRDQSDCGSCYAFSGVGAVENNWTIRMGQTNATLDLSEQFIVSCYSLLGCGGGWSTDVMATARDIGIPDEACFDYDAADTACHRRCDDWPLRTFAIDEYQVVLDDTADTPEEYEQIVLALQEGPVAVAFDVYEDFFDYDYGIYSNPSGMFAGGHAVVIVGYDIDAKYWICKNSWGSGWGESGFFRIRWGDSGMGRETLLPILPPCTREALRVVPVLPGADFVHYNTEAMPVSVRVTDDCGRGAAGTNVTATFNGMSLAFYDDGSHNDQAAGDGIFGGYVPVGQIAYGPVEIDVTAAKSGYTDGVLALSGRIKLPPDVLVIADDGDAGGSAFYGAILDELGVTYDVWEVGKQARFPSHLLPYVPAVLWFTGPKLGTFMDAEQTAMETYLDGGGKLLVSGQDLLQNIYDTRMWFTKNYFKVKTYWNDTMSENVAGVIGEPLTDGLGSNLKFPFANYTDTIKPADGAERIWQDVESKPMGLKYPADGVEGAVYQLALSAFPLEAMKQDQVATYIERVLDWFFADDCLDTDLDGYGTGGSCDGELDCRNDMATVHPGATEICDDGFDNDCNGLFDLDDPACAGFGDDDDDTTPGDDDDNDTVDDDDDDTSGDDDDDDDDDDDEGCGC